MKKYFKFLFLPGILIAFNQVQSQSIKNASFRKLKNVKKFEDLFDRKRDIPLEFGDEIVGIIDKLYISSENRFLLLDRNFKEVYLVDNQGRLIKKLSIEHEIPGYSLAPEAAAFTSTGDIILYNAPMSFLHFDRDGNFKSRNKWNHMNHYRNIIVDSMDHIYAYTISPQKVFISKMLLHGDLIKQGGVYPKENFQLIYRIGEGGCIQIDTIGNIYQTHLSGPDIYKYNSDLELVDHFKRNPKFFKKLPEESDDIFSNPARLSEMMGLMKGAVMNINLFVLNDSLLLAQYLIPKEGYALDLSTTQGIYYSCDQLRYQSKIMAVRNGMVYTIFQPEGDEDGNVPNPIVIEYSLKAFIR